MPRKLGQHFLTSEPILRALAEAACPGFEPRVVEIGPGPGALTRHLAGRTAELHAVEIDKSLAAFLRAEFAREERVMVHEGDVLETDLAQWGPAVIAGNLPYYITSPIIAKFLQMGADFRRAVFLVQWEVAQRILAKPGTRDFGYLTVATRLVCEARLICKVPAGAFSPPPTVDSGAFLLERRSGNTAPAKELLEFVKRCFGQKRKTLRNNLRPFYGNAIDRLPEARLRAEELEVAAFPQLFELLSAK